jgi:hypothetical protein
LGDATLANPMNGAKKDSSCNLDAVVVFGSGKSAIWKLTN